MMMMMMFSYFSKSSSRCCMATVKPGQWSWQQNVICDLSLKLLIYSSLFTIR